MDQNKYVNAYIESAVGMLHENISQLLQLKAQLKVTNDVIAEKDAIINDLTNRLNSNQTIEQEYHRTIKRNQELENEMTGIKNKISHVDTFSRQIVEMKGIIITKDKMIEQLTAQIKSNVHVNGTRRTKNIKTKKVDNEQPSNTNISNTDDF